MNNQAIITQGLTVEDLMASLRAIVRDEVQALPQPKPEKPYMTLAEVCELTGMARQTIYGLTHQRKIPFIKRNGKLLFNRAEIMAWIEAAAQPVID